MRATFLTVLAVFLGLAAPVHAAFRPLERGVRAVHGDGERVAVLDRADGSLALLDDKGAAPPLARPACPDAQRAAALIGVGGGMALFDCAPPSFHGAAEPRIVDLRTRAVMTAAGLEALRRRSYPYAPYVSVIGRQWALVTLDDQLKSYSVYLNWRTGEVREDEVRERRRRVVPDLDFPGLDRRLCRGVRRRIVTEDSFFGSGEVDAFDPLQYRGRHALDRRGLRRCGARRAAKVPAFGRLGADRVTWRDGADIVVRSTRSGRSTRLALPDPDPATICTETGTRLYALHRDRVWVARAPRG